MTPEELNRAIDFLIQHQARMAVQREEDRELLREMAVQGKRISDLIVIEFANMASALGWYNSPQYQKIKPLRTNNATSTVFLVEGVPADHCATDILR